MQINTGLNATSVAKGVAQATTVRETKSEKPQNSREDEVSFPGTEALRKALEQTPDVRHDAIDHSRELLANVQWPPSETITRIAELLAANIGNTD